MNPNEWSVKSEVTALVVAGLALAVIGTGIAYAAWPAEEVAAGLAVEETGSLPLAMVGALLAAVGQLLAAVGVIAVGVRLGSRD